MARLARVVAPGLPHHVTRPGNRRQDSFPAADDVRVYPDPRARGCAHYGVEVWAYCLMTNHVHLIAVPETADALGLAIGEAQGAIPGTSTSARAGGATCGRGGSPPSRWTGAIFW